MPITGRATYTFVRHNQVKPKCTTTLTSGSLWHRNRPHPAASGKRLPSHPVAVGMLETRVKTAQVVNDFFLVYGLPNQWRGSQAQTLGHPCTYVFIFAGCQDMHSLCLVMVLPPLQLLEIRLPPTYGLKHAAAQQIFLRYCWCLVTNLSARAPASC